MLGRGLESLIPNTKGEGTNDSSPYFPPAHTPQPVPVPPPTASAPLPVHDEVWPHHEPPHAHEERESIFLIEIEKIKPNPYQPRREFNTEELSELAQSIREFGVIQPITVSRSMKEAPAGAEVEYQLIAGERRLRASKLAGLTRIPAIVKKIDAGKTKLEIALIENIQRSNLNPLESAKAYARLQEEFGMTQREIATRVGKSREAVANTMRLLGLPTPIQEAISRGELSESQGRTLLSIQDPNEQVHTFRAMLEKRGAPRVTHSRSVPPPAALPHDDPQQKFWERQLEEKLGAPVRIKKQGTGGTIGIQYYSNEELRGILERLTGGM